MIWRRVLVPESVSPRELHGVHPYYFDIHTVHYGSFDLVTESADTLLSRFQFRFRAKDRFAYLYDMGDCWKREVRIEKFPGRHPKKACPVCTGGSGVCPPEECGATPGNLEWREEATGYDAWSDLDLDLVAGFAAGALESGAGSLTENDREAIHDALGRMAARAPFLDTTVSRRAVNKDFRAGRHLKMIRQQLI